MEFQADGGPNNKFIKYDIFVFLRIKIYIYSKKSQFLFYTSDIVILKDLQTGFGTAFFDVLNASFFCILSKHEFFRVFGDL